MNTQVQALESVSILTSQAKHISRRGRWLHSDIARKTVESLELDALVTSILKDGREVRILVNDLIRTPLLNESGELIWITTPSRKFRTTATIKVSLAPSAAEVN